MSEVNERNLENVAPEAAEDREMKAAEAVQAADSQEYVLAGAPAEENAAEEKAPEKKKGKKKRRGRGIPVVVAVLLLVIALAFGTVFGYSFGRNVGAERLREAEARVEELTAALEEAQSTPAYDVFEEELTQENQALLDELAGTAFENSGDAMILLEEELFGTVLPEADAVPPVVVAEYDGGKLMSDEVAREYGEQMATLVFAGYTEEEIAGVLLDEVLKYMVSDRVLEVHAREMGLYELTDEDRAKIEEEARRSYGEQLEFYRDFVNTEGMTDEEATGAVKAYMQEDAGVTLEGVRAELEDGWWMQKMYDEITGGVEVDEAALKEAYDALLERQKKDYETYPDDFEFAQRNGETIVYNLPGYRAVRMLLFGFENIDAYEAVPVLTEEISELDPAVNAAEISDYKNQIDGFYAGAEARAADALKQLQAGADFEELIVSIGEDEGMMDEKLRRSGYFVSEKSMLWPKEMVEAAMALEKSGDVSGVVRMDEGVCILQYVGEVPAGEVPLDDVREILLAETLESAKYSAYEAQLDQWVREVNAVYYPERMQ